LKAYIVLIGVENFYKKLWSSSFTAISFGIVIVWLVIMVWHIYIFIICICAH